MGESMVLEAPVTIAFTRHWATFGDGNYNDPNNWSDSAVPTDSDRASFEIGGNLTFTVTFPGNLFGEALASYTVAALRVHRDTITFSGSAEFNRDDATYAVASSEMSEGDRGIIIGVDPGNTAVLNISPASPSGLGLASFSCVAATLGDAAGSTGTLNVEFGAFNVTGSDFTATQLIVGNHGTGSLNISNGAKLNVTGFNSRVTLGNYATGIGSVTVSGTGSKWTINDGLSVGGSGSGTLLIEDGGRLRSSSASGSDSTIGTSPGGRGEATVTGPGSIWAWTNRLFVGGFGGDGILTIADGGGVIGLGSGFIGIGTFGNSGTATVTGPGSTLNMVGSLDVGSTGTGALEILNGGSVTSGSGLIRGLNAGSGRVLVAGAGSTWTVTNGALEVGLPEGGFITGPTRLTIDPGGTVSVADKIEVRPNGLVELHGGTLSANEIDLASGHFDWTSGTLHMNFFLFSDLTNQGGKLVPGLVNGGAATGGTYTQLAGAELEIEIGGTSLGTQYGFLGLEGPASLDGLLRLTLTDGFVPTAAQTFRVLGAPSGIFGAFSNVAFGQRLTTTDGLGSFVVNHLPPDPTDPEFTHHVVLTDFAISP
jgi:T5SS/PEP-CTERM-associated repeat protein